MESLRSFLFVWLALAAAVVAYAFADLHLNPWITVEGQLTLEPDFTQIGALMHWGGRLLRVGALPMLVGNALALGGIGAFAVQALGKRLGKLSRRRSRPPSAPNAEPARVSVFY